MSSEPCRLCGFVKPNTQPIFVETSKGLPVNELKSSLPGLISTYLYLNIDRNDVLPKTICLDCYHKLKRWNIFALKCKKTQKNLKEIQIPYASVPISSPIQGNDCSSSPTLPILAEFLAESQECAIRTITIKSEEEEIVNCTPPEVDIRHLVSFETEKSLESKIVTTEPVVYSCNYCDKTYSNKRTHSRHVSIMHENRQEFHCAHCSKTFYVKPALKCHLETHALSRDFCCHVCGSTFRTGSALRCHLQLHRHNYAAFECEQCGKRFKLAHQLERHRKTHSNLRPYQCTECNLNFVLRNNLTRHIEAVHDLVTKRACPTCGKEYRYLNHYRAHLLRHAGQRDNKCDVCAKSFVTRNDLMRHARTHTREKPFKCTLCSKTFADCSNRKRHILSHEGKSKSKSKSKATVKKNVSSEETKTYTSLETYYQRDEYDNIEYDNIDDVLMTTSACYEAAGNELKTKESYGIYMKSVEEMGGEEGMFLTEGEFGEMEMPVFLEVEEDGGEAMMKDEGEMFLGDAETTAEFVIGSEILIDGSLLGP